MKNPKNNIELTGYAGTDPVIIDFADNKRLARVSLAFNETYTNSAGESVANTIWFNLVFWNAKVALVESLKKGDHISIEGKLSIQSYETKTGEQRFSTEIIVHQVEITEK